MSRPTSSAKKTKSKVPLAIKRVRKEIPPPGRVSADRKKYSRKKAKEELERALEENVEGC